MRRRAPRASCFPSTPPPFPPFPLTTGSLKFHTNVDVDDGLRLVADYAPQVGETVELLRERVRTRFVAQETPAAENDDDLASNKTPSKGDLFGTGAPVQAWASVSFAVAAPRPPRVLQQTRTREWVPHAVVAVAVDAQTFTLRDARTEKVVCNVARGRVRPLGSELALLAEPHVCFGSVQDQTAGNEIVAARCVCAPRRHGGPGFASGPSRLALTARALKALHTPIH